MKAWSLLGLMMHASLLTVGHDARAMIGGERIERKLEAHERAIVGLQMFTNRNVFIGNCTGVLIRADAVLTAAHCFDVKIAPALSWTRVLRQTNINTFSEDSRSRRAKEVVPHPLYNSQAQTIDGRYYPAYDHDLAIVFLDAAMPPLVDGDVSAPIEVARLPDPSLEITAGTRLISYGFGRSREVSFFAVEDSNYLHLQTGAFTATGRRLYGSFTMTLSELNFCNGDSGGPAFLVGHEEAILMAVTSSAASGTTWYGRRRCRGEGSLQPVASERAWIDQTLRSHP